MKKMLLLATLFLLVLGMLALSPVAFGQRTYPLENCRAGAFSTEEDFMMTEGEPYDGNPYISDGDLLSPSGQLCARNADLLVNFNPAGVAAADLGLDAIDILDFKDRLAAFSTSLDDPFGKFSAGDLLFTDGGVIPNSALVARFGIKHDIGLDAVQLIGKTEQIRGFVDRVREANPDGWNQGLLDQLLETFDVDIWFSIEGTYWGAENQPILDGDLLSAKGFIVAPNSVLLPPDVPAGLPTRGVDFGLDAVAANNALADQPIILFSTEILYRGERTFTDGDVLLMGDGVKALNEDLIAAWHPRADFLGLDALWLLTEPPPLEDPFITHLCGDRSVGDFDGGLVGIGGSGTGLHRNGPPDAAWPDGRPRQPCGRFVPVDGFMPDTGVNRFRVAYRKAGDPYLGVDTHDGIQTSWFIYQRAPFWPFPCVLSGNLSTDAKGWMDAATYQGYKDGTLTGGCPNAGLKLAVWNTDGAIGFDPGPADPNGHYVLWLEFDDGVIDREPVEHHLQLDNTLPVIHDFKVTLADGSTPVDACGEAPNGENIFKIYGDFADDYYWGYKLRVRGGNPPGSKTYGWHNYYDGTPPVVNTDRTGTTPDGNTVFLRDIDMEQLPHFTDCCYVLDLWVRDGAIRHSFNKRTTNDVSGSNGWWANDFLTFAAAPAP